MIFHQLYCRKCALFFIMKLQKEPCPICGWMMLANYHKDNLFDKGNEMIEITTKDFARRKNVKWLDFAFNVPNNYQPVLIEFKQNNIAELPLPVSAEKAPPPEPFEKKSKKKKSTVKP